MRVNARRSTLLYFHNLRVSGQTFREGRGGRGRSWRTKQATKISIKVNESGKLAPFFLSERISNDSCRETRFLCQLCAPRAYPRLSTRSLALWMQVQGPRMDRQREGGMPSSWKGASVFEGAPRGRGEYPLILLERETRFRRIPSGERNVTRNYGEYSFR